MRVTSRLCVAVSCSLLSLAMCSPALAQAPSLSTATPRAVRPGETTQVTLRGGNLAGPTQLWTSFPGEATLDSSVAKNGENPGQVVYSFQVPADTPPGVHGLRIATDKGVSNLLLFVVDDLSSVAQAKPNNDVGQAQVLTIPCAVDGNVDSLVRNYYKFSVAAGQTLSIEVLARRIGSPLDPMIRLLDAQGRELAYSDDAPGLGSDAQLRHTFSQAGDYVLEVRDVRFQGGGNFAYRLRIGDFPCVTVPYPMGVKRGQAATLQFAGPHIEGIAPLEINVPSPPDLEWLPIGAKRAGGVSSGFVYLSLSDQEESLEQEPNDEAANSNRVTLGAHLNGRFEKPGDVDRFVFTAKANQRFTFSGITRQQGSPTDLYLRLLKSDGAQVAAADDTGTSEGVIDYTFPADGDYTLVVEDLHRRGGSEFAYRIATAEYKPGFALAASTDTLNVPAEGTAAVTVTSVRTAYNGPIELSLAGAPEGIKATPAVLANGQNSVVMTIENAGGVPAGKIYPVQIVGRARVAGVDFEAAATVTEAQKTAFSGMPLPPPQLARNLVVGVNPRPFYVLRSQPGELVFGKSLSATVKIKALRAEDFKEAITLAVTPAQNGLPAGITAAVKPIEKDKDEVEIVFTANDKVALGEFTAVLAGTGKKGNETVVQSPPAIRLVLRAPFTLKTDFGEAKIAKGEKLKVKIVAERNPAYNGPITLTFANLPRGVTAPAVTIPEGQTEVEAELSAAADAPAAEVTNIQVKGAGSANNAKFSETAPNAKLTVE